MKFWHNVLSIKYTMLQYMFIEFDLRCRSSGNEREWNGSPARAAGGLLTTLYADPDSLLATHVIVLALAHPN